MLHLIIGDLKSFSKVTNKFSPMTGVLTCNTWLEQPRLSLCSDFLSCEDNAAFTLVLPLLQCTVDVTVQAALFCTVLDALVQCSVGSLLLLVLASPSPPCNIRSLGETSFLKNTHQNHFQNLPFLVAILLFLTC